MRRNQARRRRDADLLDILRAWVVLALTERIDRRPELGTARLHWILERPRLPLVVPAFWPQPLGFLEIFLGRLRLSAFEQKFAEPEIRGGAHLCIVRRVHPPENFRLAEREAARRTIRHPIADRVQVGLALRLQLG